GRHPSSARAAQPSVSATAWSWVLTGTRPGPGAVLAVVRDDGGPVGQGGSSSGGSRRRAPQVRAEASASDSSTAAVLPSSGSAAASPVPAPAGSGPGSTRGSAGGSSSRG